MYSRDKIIQTLHEIHEESLSIKPYVVVAQPRRVQGETPAQNFNGHTNIHMDLHGHSHGFVDIYGEKVDVARNYLIEQVIDSGAKYMFFIGEDTVVPYNAFDLLHKTAEANPNSIVAGVYYIKCSNAMVMTRENNHVVIPNVDPGQVFEAWQTGMDCLLIPTEILKRMRDQEPELPYCCIANNIPGIPFVGEDNFFVYRIRKMGVKLLVNTDVQCLHMDLATGKYTAHPDVSLSNYLTLIKPTEPLTWADKDWIDRRWVDRLPQEGMQLIQNLLNKGEAVKFHMGCGDHILPGYINVDKHAVNAQIKQDILTLELPMESVDEILAIHVLEHQLHTQVPVLLQRWHQALKPGAQLILETPDLAQMCAAFVNASESERYMLTMCMYGIVGNNVDPKRLQEGTASTHLWGWYPEQLIKLLQDVGFAHVQVLPIQGNHPGINFRVEATK